MAVAVASHPTAAAVTISAPSRGQYDVLLPASYGLPPLEPSEDGRFLRVGAAPPAGHPAATAVAAGDGIAAVNGMSVASASEALSALAAANAAGGLVLVRFASAMAWAAAEATADDEAGGGGGGGSRAQSVHSRTATLRGEREGRAASQGSQGGRAATGGAAAVAAPAQSSGGPTEPAAAAAAADGGGGGGGSGPLQPPPVAAPAPPPLLLPDGRLPPPSPSKRGAPPAPASPSRVGALSSREAMATRLAEAERVLRGCERLEAEAARTAAAKAGEAQQAASRAAAAADAAEEAAAVEAAAQGAAVSAAIEVEAAAEEAKLDGAGSVAELAAHQAAVTELTAAENAAADASIAKERAMEAAVAAAVAAHAIEEQSAQAFLAHTRARNETEYARLQLSQLRPPAGGGSGGGGSGGGGGGGSGPLDPGATSFPALSFDAGALQEIRAAGPLLPPSQIPTAVAAVFASLAAAPEAEAELGARLMAAVQRRAEAEAERAELRVTAASLRRYVPIEGSDELMVQLRLEVSRRQQVEAEFRHVKSRVDDIAQRIGRLRDTPLAPRLHPAEYRWRARGATVLPPGPSMDLALEQMSQSVHSLSEKLMVPPPGAEAPTVERPAQPARRDLG
jgi:chemotaxis protein histidine kinase CheA